MKKLLLLVIASLALFSCEGPMGPQGPQGVPGEGMFWKYYTYTVKSQDWELVNPENGLTPYYIYIFSNSDLTDDLYLNGYVLGYLVQSPGTQDEVITPLPYYYEGEKWKEFISYDFMPGSVAFYVQYDNFVQQRPEDLVFRVILNN